MRKLYQKPMVEITDIAVQPFMTSSNIPIGGKGTFDSQEDKDWNIWSDSPESESE